MPPPPSRRLGHEVHAVRIGDDLVALDLHRHAYLCLPGLGGQDLVDALAAAGLSVAAASAPSPYAPPPLPRADLGIVPATPMTLGGLADAAVATLDIFARYRGAGLPALIDAVERSRPAAAADDAATLALAEQFSRWVTLAPVPGKCLVRAFMLLRHLHRHGASAQWVFGVRTWPFRAHCWVQLGDKVLDDHHERLVPYSPLLAVPA